MRKQSRTTRSSPRNSNSRNTKSRNSLVGVPRGVSILADGSSLQYGFPNRLLSKVRYCDNYPITSTAGSIAKQVMNLNSTFDPDATGVGHQPLYRDTFAGIYTSYAVIDCDVIVTIVSNASTSAMIAGILVEDDSSTSASVTTLMEQANGQHVLLPNATGAPSVHTFRYRWDCKKFLQIDPYSSEEYKTAVGSNPTQGVCLLIWAAPADGASTTSTLVQVTLEMTVLWTELQTPTGS